MIGEPYECMEPVSVRLRFEDWEGELRRVGRRKEAPRGGLKMSFPRSSWSIPRMMAARWAAAGLRKHSLPLTAPAESDTRISTHYLIVIVAVQSHKQLTFQKQTLHISSCVLSNL